MDAKSLSVPVSHYAGAVVSKLAPMGGLVSVLAFPYTMPNGVTQIRLPGGGSHEGETPEETLRRELEAEASKERSAFAIKPGEFWKIHQAVVPSQDGAGEHHKIFFLIPIEALICTLRHEKKTENDHVVLGVPAWHEAEALVKRMFSDHTPKHHVIAVLKSLKITAEVSPAAASRYGAFLASCEPYLKANS
ncbi:MAG: NUDIX domain-containing protein [Candidatus Paceibacterota bacterium]|jgi:8-oxo-dGTP pyrophosphatase MutT (NUDIX family)